MSTNSSLISSGITVEELSQKYQKLLQEYNRIRAQHSVLRKAIVNEQSNNVDLTNELKNKENDLRKYSLEIDNLIFHNRGLNKKIEALQEEGPKKKSSSWLPNNQLKKEMQEVKIALDAAVLDLENKIHENESLYLELDEIKSNHQIAIDELKSQNQTLQLKISQILNEYELKIKDFEDGVSTLKREKSVVETEMRKVLETMKK
ncbi:hypothetical protein CONCODRAFT_95680 [Conidiobolus coronatus NRRL 28638]|uniref:Protein phosphatase 1 regulatory subunit 21 N-terminal domain-containing protein n=1 Tax=Conidiobolus coronatus (strain ATCC 28846 / CBS 209.66 / NRRL 28638) TaxID=796925 RepID=A0A137P304_CONC2|nr:hypothetical protein CONCODRAFT_95680 [Conidiobolus coronatus NRRL 28638]|eukprot:KXN69410.1 hypothetical protein CONCODRAFT_95680 [Conidiobolus coronatus NRRL 28638]